MSEKKEANGSFTFDQDSKRFHRFKFEAVGGIVGNIYIPKDSNGIPEKITLDYKPEG